MSNKIIQTTPHFDMKCESEEVVDVGKPPLISYTDEDPFQPGTSSRFRLFLTYTGYDFIYKNVIDDCPYGIYPYSAYGVRYTASNKMISPFFLASKDVIDIKSPSKEHIKLIKSKQDMFGFDLSTSIGSHISFLIKGQILYSVSNTQVQVFFRSGKSFVVFDLTDVKAWENDFIVFFEPSVFGTPAWDQDMNDWSSGRFKDKFNVYRRFV